MIQELAIKNFRGIESVEFSDLGRVNLIIGGNNTGKTSVLEALMLLAGDQKQLQSLPTLFREVDSNDEWSAFWPYIARNGSLESIEISYNSQATITIGSHVKAGIYRTKLENLGDENDARFLGNLPREDLIVDLSNRRINEAVSPWNLRVLSTAQPTPKTTSELFNAAIPANPENEVKLEALLKASIEPRLKRMRYLKPSGFNNHIVMVDLGSGTMIPFTQMGQAFARALHIYCEIFAHNPDILIIDEIENGLYHAGLGDFWKGLIRILESEEVQLFATTHSRECMEAAHQANRTLEEPSSLRYLRLDRTLKEPETIVGTVFDSDTMATAIEHGEEMR